MERMSRSQAARAAGVGAETLRFYETEGLIDPPRRGASAYREYSPETVSRVRFIRRAKELGFSLKEIRQLLALSDSSEASCEEARTRAEIKVAEIDRKIRDLRRVREAVSELIETCEQRASLRECPILRALED